jgi:predicted ribosome quality control (RQC) complex YloA/Tae2 family protein
VDAQLQDIYISEKVFLLTHYRKGPITLGVTLDLRAPLLGVFFDEPPKQKWRPKPLTLFLKAHAKNKKLVSIEVKEEWGRVVELRYGNPDRGDEFICEIRLIPHALNIITTAQVEPSGSRINSSIKKMSLFPEKELKPTAPFQVKEDSVFNVNSYLDFWRLGLFAGSSNKKIISDEDLVKKQIEKKSQGLLRLNKDKEELELLAWARAGEYIKGHQSLDVPADWLNFVDLEKSLAENITRCFEEAKIQEKRLQILNEKIIILQSDIEKFSEGGFVKTKRSKDQPPTRAAKLMDAAGAKGRKLVLSESIEAIIGKSAKDNLMILRKAQAWDIWIHLKDLPGSHGIIHRSRGETVTREQIEKVAEWVLSQSLGKRKALPGERYDVLYTECRFVKPIRGDHVGRVNYHNESVLTLRIK